MERFGGVEVSAVARFGLALGFLLVDELTFGRDFETHRCSRALATRHEDERNWVTARRAKK